MSSQASSHPDYPMWSSLLRWSLAQGGDGTTSSPQGPMSDEKREFLEAALKSLGADAAERQKAIFEAIGKYVEAPSEELVDKCAEALEALEDDVIDLDAARDLLKLGCFGLVLKSVSAEHGEVSGAACAQCGVQRTQPGVKLRMCQRCKQAWYCSEACQRAAWRRSHLSRMAARRSAWTAATAGRLGQPPG